MTPALYIVDTPEKRSRLAKRIEALPVEGEVWEVMVKEWEPRRSLEQNARLHLIFHRVAQKIGDDLESVKLGYKALFLPGKEVDFHGHKVMVYPKTSRMTKAQLNDFMLAVETHAITEHGIVLGENEYAY
jgi:hypothetical protein